jgi:hypothetical protein
MRTIYSWKCPKCGKRYENGSEPTFCDQPLLLKAPTHPRADAETGRFETRCGAPILPLSPPQVESDRDPRPFGEAKVSDEIAQPDGPIMQTVMRVINERNWRHSRHETRPMVELPLTCAKSVIRLVVSAREKEQQVIVYAMLAELVPPDRRAAAAEFLARVNHNCCIGAFDIDFEEGGVRFRVGIDVEGGGLTEKMVENLFDMSAYAADAHHEGLMRVVYGGADPKGVMARPRA